MTGAELALLQAAAPAVKDVVFAIVKGIQGGDDASVRKATEAALRLVFEARQAVSK